MLHISQLASDFRSGNTAKRHASQAASRRRILIIEQTRHFSRSIQARNRHIVGRQHSRIQIRLDTTVRESQVTRAREAKEGRLGNGIRPVGLVRLQTSGRLAIELHEIKGLIVDSSVEIINCLFQLLGVEVEFLCQLFDCVGLFGRHVCCLVDPAALEAVRDYRVTDERAGHVLIFPGVQGCHFEGGEEVAFTFVVEAFAVVVDEDAVVVTPDDSVGLSSSVDINVSTVSYSTDE